MKAFALTVMIATLLGFAMLALNVLVVSVTTPAGLLNPIIHFELVAGTRDEFLACLLASVIAAYFYAVVAWIDERLHRLRVEALRDAPVPRLAQPLEVRQLKGAIRAGDLPAIRRYATETALAYCDDRFMTALELAELYGRADVIQTLRRATQARTPARFTIDAGRAEAPREHRRPAAAP